MLIDDSLGPGQSGYREMTGGSGWLAAAALLLTVAFLAGLVLLIGVLPAAGAAGGCGGG